MPGLGFVQANVAYYSVAGSGGNLPCAFTSHNIQGNIGIAWVANDDSSTPSGVTDTQGNTWYQMPGFSSNVGCSNIWVCPSLKAGANTVTAAGLTPYTTGSPNFIILEYEPPPCPQGTTGIQCMQPAIQGDTPFSGSSPQLFAGAIFKPSGGTWFSTLIAFIKCGPNSSSSTSRTWSITVPAYAISSGVRLQYAEPTGTATGAVADCVVPYPNVVNSILFGYSPGSPVVNNGETKLIYLLVNTIL